MQIYLPFYSCTAQKWREVILYIIWHSYAILKYFESGLQQEGMKVENIKTQVEFKGKWSKWNKARYNTKSCDSYDTILFSD